MPTLTGPSPETVDTILPGSSRCMSAMSRKSVSIARPPVGGRVTSNEALLDPVQVNRVAGDVEKKALTAVLASSLHGKKSWSVVPVAPRKVVARSVSSLVSRRSVTVSRLALAVKQRGIQQVRLNAVVDKFDKGVLPTRQEWQFAARTTDRAPFRVNLVTRESSLSRGPSMLTPEENQKGALTLEQSQFNELPSPLMLKAASDPPSKGTFDNDAGLSALTSVSQLRGGEFSNQVGFDGDIRNLQRLLDGACGLSKVYGSNMLGHAKSFITAVTEGCDADNFLVSAPERTRAQAMILYAVHVRFNSLRTVKKGNVVPGRKPVSVACINKHIKVVRDQCTLVLGTSDPTRINGVQHPVLGRLLTRLRFEERGKKVKKPLLWGQLAASKDLRLRENGVLWW